MIAISKINNDHNHDDKSGKRNENNSDDDINRGNGDNDDGCSCASIKTLNK